MRGTFPKRLLRAWVKKDILFIEKGMVDGWFWGGRDVFRGHYKPSPSVFSQICARISLISRPELSSFSFLANLLAFQVKNCLECYNLLKVPSSLEPNNIVGNFQFVPVLELRAGYGMKGNLF